MSTHSPHSSDATASILVADDTPDNLRLLLRILSEAGYEVRPVTDGERAIAAAQLDPPDLILLDIKMPGMDGYEACRNLKADERTRDIPVMFLTVLDDVVDIIKGFELGGVDYITKPVRTGELLARIENQMALRSLQQKLIEKTEFLDSIYNGVEASISVVDVLENGQFRVAQVNDTALRMSGLTREQIEGLDLRQLMSEETIRDNHQACIDLGVPITREASIVIQGETVWWLSTHTPLRNEQGKIVRLIGTGINITDRKQAELQLAEKSEELYNTLETLQSTQTDLIRSAKMAALGNLVAGVAHEINTPVGTAITTASTLENATKAIMADLTTDNLKRSSFESYLAVAAECSQLILNNLNRAGELIHSFKQVAVDQTSLQARTFALKPYLQEIITNLTPTLKKTPHRITLSGSNNITLHSYPGALSQIMTNLIINSINHGYPHPPGQPEPIGHLRIVIHHQPGEVVLQYSDDGQGIEPDDQHRIFEPFFTTARDLGGSGLGLHLIYNLVTQTLQGRIQVASSPGNGTAFTLTLPDRLEQKSSD
ncbi:MAG: response regulator [Cyanobacteria bacterium P01_F01_bin.53]